MNIASIYDQAVQRGVYLYLEEGRLLFKAQGGLDPAIRELLKNHKPELIEYLQYLEEVRSRAEVVLEPIKAIAPAARQEPTRLSYGQQQLIFLDQLHGGTSNFNIPAAYRVYGPLNIAALGEALRCIIERHEVLRTVFCEHAGEMMQKVQSEYALPFFVHDFSDIAKTESADACQAQVMALLHEDAARRFDVQQDVLVRLSIIVLNPEEHIFLFNTHHIASDGWSIGIFMGELATLYNALVRLADVSLPQLDLPALGLQPLAIQYRDYAVWQRELLEGAAIEQMLDYWKKQLADISPGINLPFDKARDRNGKFAPAEVRHIVSEQLTSQLNALCKQRNVTLFMLMQSALAVLLQRYSGDTDIPIGTAIAGRPRLETESLIGFFVNTLVLRSDLAGNPRFCDVLESNRQMVLSAFAHQHIPFPMLVEELKPERNTGSSPFFQVMLILQNNAGGGVDFSGLRFENMRQNSSVNEFDLELDVSEFAGQLYFTWSYNAELFCAASVARMAANFEVLLASIVAQPEASINNLPLLCAAEQQQLLEGWNDTHAPYPHQASLAGLFEAQVLATPQALAISDGTNSLSYAQLNARANQLARHLQAQIPVQKDGQLVGLCMERSLAMVVGMLAIVKTGAAYLPLDPDYPAARLAYLISDAQAVVVLTETAHRAVLPTSVPLICLDDASSASQLANYADSNLACPIHSESAACAIYTSGSTGEPKGVLMPHRSIINRLHWMRQSYPVQDGEVFCQKTSLNFVDHVAEVFQPLTQGTPMVLIAAQAVRDVHQLIATLKKHRISRITLVPSLLSALVEHEEVHALPDLRYVISSGEALSGLLATRVKAALPHVRLLNIYGSTEVGADVTCAEFTGDAQQHGASSDAVSMGQPIANSQAYVLDSAGQLLPIGAKGELHIGGAGLALGYLHQAALTAERFIDNPYSDQAGAKLYKTGDIVRWLANGQLAYLGRKDHQLKIRGMRIEIGEIEAQLQALPEMKDAIVMPRALDPQNPELRLVAYLVSNLPIAHEETTRQAQAQTWSASCRKALKQVLPDYMIPSVFMFLSELPLTKTGKVNRLALPMPTAADMQQTQYVAPRSDMESQLCILWQTVLKVEQVGIDDNFFEIGGHSLMATRLMSLIRQQLGMELPLRLLFEQPTVAAFAEHMASFQQAALLSPITPVSRQQALLTSFAQQRLWFIDQLEQGSTEYNLPLRLQLQGELNFSAFAKAIQAIVERHEVLRTVIVEEQGQARQQVREHVQAKVLIHDLQHLDQASQAATVQRLMDADANQPFDLAKDVLLRAQLFKLAQDKSSMLLNLHHIAADGWSMGILFRELNALYDAFCLDLPSPLPALKLQYADYAQWQRQWLQGEVLEAQLSYWRSQLQGLPALHNVPLDKPRPATQSFHGLSATQDISGDLLAAIHRYCQQQQVTPFMFIYTALAVLLHRYSGEQDIVIGSPIAGRTHSDVEPLIGLFVNSLVLRSDISGAPSFEGLLQRNKQMILAGYEHQYVPFEMLVDQLHPERSLSHSPLFQIMLTLHNNEQHQIDFHGLQLERISGTHNSIKCDLELTASISASHLYIDWSYNLDLFALPTIQRMAANFEVLLAAMLAQPKLPVGQLALLDAAEKNLLLHTWNDTACDFPAEASLHAMFEEQVRTRPDALALTDGVSSLTYAQLNTRAQALAQHLRDLGVQDQALVGLCMERSLAMVVGMLAILKAGAAYLPLDPEYPEARLAYLLEDAKVALVLSQTQHRPVLPAQAQVLCLDDAGLQARLAAMSVEHISSSAAGESVACAIYTSGSTGDPKGVLMSHRCIINRLHWMRLAYPVAAGEVFCQKTSLNFVDHVAEVFQPLTQGTPLVVIDAEAVRDIGLLIATLQQHKISRITLVPSLLNVLLEHDQVHALPDLRYVISSGEPLSGQLASRLQAALPHVCLLNIYGSTEVGADVTCAQYDMASANAYEAVSMGRPIANSQAYVLDAAGQLLPLGAKGELHIGGAGLALGYLHQAALTAERFIDNPFAEVGNEGKAGASKLYKTGDMVRWLPSGELAYLGRKDHQVKIRGMRLEIGEIEAQLSRLPGVKDAVVMPVAAPSGELRLIAYVVLQHGVMEQVEAGGQEAKEAKERNNASANSYRKALKLVLPEYMVPEVYLFLPALPLTKTGKVDRKALPKPAAADLQKAAYLAPRTATEASMCQLWQGVLRVEQVGVEDNFFALGGDSIASMLLAARARQAGVPFSVRLLFTHQTIAALAAEIDSQRLETAQLANAQVDLPLAPAARYFGHPRLAESSQVQTAVFSMALDSSVDKVAQLAQLTRQLYQRHDALRCMVDMRAGVLRFARSEDLVIENLLREAAIDSEIAQVQQAQRNVILGEQGPAWQITYLPRSTGPAHLLLSLHQAICDRQSWQILQSELQAFLQRGEWPQTSPAPYAQWLRAQQDSGETRSHERAEAATQDGVSPSIAGAPASAPVSATAAWPEAEVNQAYRTTSLELLMASFCLSYAPSQKQAWDYLIISDARADSRNADSSADAAKSPYLGTVGNFKHMQTLSMQGNTTLPFEALLNQIKLQYRDSENGGNDGMASQKIDAAQVVRLEYRDLANEAPVEELCDVSLVCVPGEALVIEHMLDTDKQHLAINLLLNPATDLVRPSAQVLTQYVENIAQTVQRCAQELKDVATREKYAAVISFNQADLDQYGEEF